MIESELKSVFIGNSVFQKQVQNILLKDDFYIVPEVQFINGFVIVLIKNFLVGID